MNKYVVKLEQYGDDVILPLPLEVITALDLKEGDVLNWTDNGDGTFSMTKKKIATKLVLVDSIHTFMMRHVIEVPEDHPEYACDSVVCEGSELIEFSQDFLGSQIASYREVSKEEVVKMYREYNTYEKTLTDEDILEQSITKD